MYPRGGSIGSSASPNSPNENIPGRNNRFEKEIIMQHKTANREQWFAERLKLLEAEKELTHRGDELARQRQELPWVKIEKQYRFHTEQGPASLADLFKGRAQLVVYHFMFGPS